ncbi:NUDIX hydrolase [Streptomyces sp. SL13]|uniref:NUDIX hydrolase n=1 Tax=Streptantibioticus silvisoli TaxID=2705255 RepID=A0AA90GXG0_9ACTN|nr:NUDIX hydrolase [Streptantibioticus silvisoli]MDI5969918.1 NUDIX hydrolase [Streptantibioticus silvisoli]
MTPPGIPARVCAVILNNDEVCLIRRHRPDGDQHSLPGGIVNADEHIADALARELREELDLDVTALPEPPRLRWVQDQHTTRPGTPGTFRRLHLIHVLDLPDAARRALAATERDAEDEASVVWVDLDKTAGLHLYPAAGDALLKVRVPGAGVLLPPITDETYTWR